MKDFFKYIPILLWIIALMCLLFGLSSGSHFIQSRGSVLCLSCMGLKENENF